MLALPLFWMSRNLANWPLVDYADRSQRCFPFLCPHLSVGVQLTRIGYSLKSKPSTNDIRSAAGSLVVHVSRDCRIMERSDELRDMGKIGTEDKGGLAIIYVT